MSAYRQYIMQPFYISIYILHKFGAQLRSLARKKSTKTRWYKSQIRVNIAMLIFNALNYFWTQQKSPIIVRRTEILDRHFVD